MSARLLLDLRSLLQDEKAALLEARYDALAALADSKADLLTQLSTQDIPKEALADIQRMVERNQKLLSAAQRGVAAARDRLLAIQEVRQGLSVYDQSGSLEIKPQRAGTLERKA